MDMKGLDQKLKKYYKFLLLLIFAIAVIIRWWYLPAKAVSFAYDQARDAFLVEQLLAGDLKLLGPPVSGVPGLHHGVLYYYIIAPAYFFGHGDPVVAAYYLSFISAFGVFVVYYLAYILTKRIVPGLIAALIFAFSFEASQYANLLTNVSLAVLFVPVLYLGIYLWLAKRSKWAPVIAGIGMGFSLQSEIALAYHIIPVAFWLLVCRKNIKKGDFLKFLTALVLATSSMILAEIKFGLKGLSGLLYLFSSQDTIASGKSLGDILLIYLNQIGKSLSFTIFPLNIAFGGLIGISVIIYSLLQKTKEENNNLPSWQAFLATFILAHLVGLPFGGSNMRHIMVGATAGISAFMGIFLWHNFKKKKIILSLLVIVILTTNLVKIFEENKNGQTIFPLQVDLVLSKEIQAVDYTYQKVEEKPFSINTLTNPLYINTLWSYLYNWYGRGKYGYLPYWRGKDQIGSLGNNLKFPDQKIKTHFFIIEPVYGIPELYVTYALGEENARSSVREEKFFGNIIVQEREIND